MALGPVGGEVGLKGLQPLAGGLVIITGFDNDGAQAAYRASGYANWALAMEKRFSNE